MDNAQICDASKAEQNYIDRHLTQFNLSKVPLTQNPAILSVNRCIRDGDTVIGGILAQVYYWNILYIDVLWVDDAYRGNGYASALICDVEHKAREMGCQISHLDTFDFQAKGFYEKLGYTVFGVLENCPQGHNRYYMAKNLV